MPTKHLTQPAKVEDQLGVRAQSSSQQQSTLFGESMLMCLEDPAEEAAATVSNGER